MRLLTVIVNYKTPDMTADSVDAALRALDAMDGMDSTITVVDNDSGDGSYGSLLKHAEDRSWGARVSVVESGNNGGFGSGNNYAIRQAMESGSALDFVYLLNSDAFPGERSIGQLVTYLDEHPDVGIAGSYIHGLDGADHETVFRFPSVISEFAESLKFGPVARLLERHNVSMPIPDHDILVGWVPGCSMLLRRDVLDTVGLFDETFFLYFEETDLCRRAASAGFKTAYVRSSHVAHVGSASTGLQTWNRMPSFWFDSRRHYFTKQHGAPYFWATTMARVIGGSLWRLRCILQRRPVNEPERHLRDMVAHALSRKEKAPGSGVAATSR